MRNSIVFFIAALLVGCEANVGDVSQNDSAPTSNTTRTNTQYDDGYESNSEPGTGSPNGQENERPDNSQDEPSTASDDESTESGDQAGTEQADATPDTEGSESVSSLSRPIRDVEGEIVELKKAMAQNPDLVPVDGTIRGSDPLSIAGSVYVTLRARPKMLMLQRAIKNHELLNEEFPSIEQFKDMCEQHGVDFQLIKPYQKYGYDQKEGKLVLLEDKAEKIRVYKEHGVPLPEEDRQYE